MEDPLFDHAGCDHSILYLGITDFPNTTPEFATITNATATATTTDHSNTNLHPFNFSDRKNEDAHTVGQAAPNTSDLANAAPISLTESLAELDLLAEDEFLHASPMSNSSGEMKTVRNSTYDAESIDTNQNRYGNTAAATRNSELPQIVGLEQSNLRQA